MESVLVTFLPQSSQRQIIADVFDGQAQVRFLPEVDDKDRDQALASAGAIIAGSIATELKPRDYLSLDRARLIQIVPAGANRVPFDRIPERIVIASNVGAYAGPMAEHVLAMVLALAKNLVSQNTLLKQGKWDRSANSRAVLGATAGIVGFGGIGRQCARLFRSLGMDIMALNRSGTTIEEVVFVGTLHDLDHVLRQSDVVVIALPLTNRTRNLIDSRRLNRMRHDAILINVARGALIDEKALYARAKEYSDFRVGLDVWWGEPFSDGCFATTTPILDLPNVIGSPHNSGQVAGIWDAAIGRASENALRFLLGKEVAGVVDRNEYV